MIHMIKDDKATYYMILYTGNLALLLPIYSK